MAGLPLVAGLQLAGLQLADLQLAGLQLTGAKLLRWLLGWLCWLESQLAGSSTGWFIH